MGNYMIKGMFVDETQAIRYLLNELRRVEREVKYLKDEAEFKELGVDPDKIKKVWDDKNEA